MSVATQMSPAQVAKQLSIDERRLLTGKRRGVLTALNFIGNNGVRYFDREWSLPYLLSLVNIIKGGR